MSWQSVSVVSYYSGDDAKCIVLASKIIYIDHLYVIEMVLSR